MRKILYIILDGLGDLPVPSLKGNTPLEASFTPFMDRLSKEGKTGLLYPVGEPVAPESDVAVISLLGYEPKKYYTGRGPLEAAGFGIEMKDGDLVFRGNFATSAPDGKRIVDRRVGRNLTTEEATILAKEITREVKLEGAEFVFKNTVGHRAVLLIRVKNTKLSSWITNTDPAYDREGLLSVAREDFDHLVEEAHPMAGYENDSSCILASKLTNDFTRKAFEVLKDSEVNKKREKEGQLPANIILVRDAGSELPKFEPLSKKMGMKLACFVQMPVERGIAYLTKMDVIDVGFSDSAPEEYQKWAKRAAEEIKTYDGLYIHIKGPDEPGHDGDVTRKREIIELIDRHFFANLLPALKKEDVIIAVTADHSTPCILKSHSPDPVPLLIWGGEVEKDDTEYFGEKFCKEGSLGIVKGPELFSSLVKLARK